MDSRGRDALAYALRLAHAELERKRREQESLQAGLEQLEQLLDGDATSDAQTIVPGPLGVPHLRGD